VVKVAQGSLATAHYCSCTPQTLFTYIHTQAVALSLGEEVSEDGAIIGPELLLAALECCGVDNAR